MLTHLVLCNIVISSIIVLLICELSATQYQGFMRCWWRCSSAVVPVFLGERIWGCDGVAVICFVSVSDDIGM